MRIAVISTMQGSAWGGSEELWADMALQALAHGMEVVISKYKIGNTPKKLISMMKKGAHLHYRRHPSSSPIIRIFFKAIQNRLISPFNRVFSIHTDVICISQGGTYECAGLNDLVAHISHSSRPYVIICHSSSDYYWPDPKVRLKTIQLFNSAYRVIFVSDESLGIAERQLATEIRNATVMRNPVNLRKMVALEWPRSTTCEMAVVGHLRTAWKGQDLLFEALGYDHWSSRDWRLKIYGEGPDKEYLSRLAEHCGISSRVDFCGHVEDVSRIWADNHLLIVPSRVEGAPLVLVEAMVCGRPCVATDVGGISEWVEDSKTGFIAEAANAKYLGRALDRAWSARSRWEEMGMAAHKKAMGQIDPTPGKRLLNVLIDAAGSQSVE